MANSPRRKSSTRRKRKEKSRSRIRQKTLRQELLEARQLLAGDAFDFGDAPDAFPTLLEWNGARHVVPETPVVYLGTAPDVEPNGQPNLTATGDDLVGVNDEDPGDGVTFAALLTAGDPAAEVVLDVTAPVEGAVVNAWIDFGNDWSWAEPGDQILTDEPVVDGVNNLTFAVPQDAAQGEDLFVRFRISSEEGLWFYGPADDGEVEDHVVQVAIDPLDYGDAPTPFPTLLGWNGARHLVPDTPTIYFGTVPDIEADGQPNSTATGDDLVETNDEAPAEGVVFPAPLTAGDPAAEVKLDVTAPTEGAFVSAWIDFGNDWSWADPGDQILTDEPVVDGLNNLSFTVPQDAVQGEDLFVRFRISSETGLSFDGLASDGEVEDHTAQVAIDPLDYGDAPWPYPTLLDSDGARHVVGGTLLLGADIDIEADGQPNATATGDDLAGDTPDDEDGVVFDEPLMVGGTGSVDVTVTEAGLLNAWIDFAGDGSWAEPGDQIFTNQALVGGLNAGLTFPVPLDTVPNATLFSRFRVSTAADLSFVGEAADGEVEDHTVTTEIEPLDFGDAPADYPTTLALDGARHRVPDNPVLYLGPPAIADPVVVHVSDQFGMLGIVEVTTGLAETIGDMGVVMTDIAFDSLGNLWGISATDIYTINPNNAATALVGAHGINGGNALAFSSTGTLFAAGEFTSDLYTINTGNGLGTVFDDIGFQSAGDLDFIGSSLYMSSTTDELIDIDLALVGTPPIGTAVGPIGFPAVFGLATADNGVLYGTAFDDVISIDPTTGTGTFEVDFSGQGLGQTLGASFTPGTAPPAAPAPATAIDIETDGQPSGAANGDDLAGVDDETGVVFPESLIVGDLAAPVDVTASADGLLNAWIDFGDDGSWAEPGDQIFTDLPVVAGENNLTFVIPGSAVQGENLAARFRLDSAGGLSFTGLADDGEVEDYVVQIGPNTPDIGLDYGDAPSYFPTTLEWDGARHVVQESPTLFLGTTVDIEVDGQPNDSATGGDLAGQDDEDGVVFPSALVAGDVAATVNVTASADGLLNAWIDFNNNGSWADPGEQIFDNQVVVAGPNNLTFVVPGSAVQSTSVFSRFRVSTNGDLSFTGEAEDGEVEDHLVQMAEPIFEAGMDYGDAPVWFPTTLQQNGARHRIPDNPTLFLGTVIDIETNGQPDDRAVGDDTNGLADEDGVVFPAQLVAGDITATVEVTASAAGLLNAWIDFGNDESWAEPNDQIFVDEPVTAGLNTLTFVVPGDAAEGESVFSRFRISSAPGLTVYGVADDGEVEDLMVQVGPDTPVGFDFGDAPDWFPTTLEWNGARHLTGGNLLLGAVIDIEDDGQPNATATGDDRNGEEVNGVVVDDEDGVVFSEPLLIGETATVNVTVTRAGLLNAWIDFRDDGSWAEPGDRIFANEPLVAGNNTLTFDVPLHTAPNAAVFSRFRVSTDGNLSFDGEAADGEVEDYLVQTALESLDYGDAPAPFPTQLEWDGARHVVPDNPTLFLGVGAGEVILDDEDILVIDALDNLFTYDVTTFDITVIGDVGVTTNIDTPRDIAFDNTGNLFGIFDGVLYEINAFTAAPTLIGDTGIAGGNALVFAGDGTLYAASEDDTLLYTIDPTDATATVFGDIGFPSAGDLDFNAAGQLFMTSPTDPNPFPPPDFFDTMLIEIDLTAVGILGTDLGDFDTIDETFGLANPVNDMLYGVTFDEELLLIDTANPDLTAVIDSWAAEPGLVGARGATSIPFDIIGGGVSGEIDIEVDGQPNATATGDDNAGADDENGVSFPTELLVGDAAANVTVIVSADGLLDAWIDFGNDGSWAEAGDQIFSSEFVDGGPDNPTGVNNLTFQIPATAVEGVNLFTRFRVSTAGGLSFDGKAEDGEVEDYVVQIGPDAPAVALDFGDAPDRYPTTLEWNGARHRVGVGPTLFFGLAGDPEAIDTEPDGQPTVTATGDNVAGSDDEQGVVFATDAFDRLTAGNPAAEVTVTIPVAFVPGVDEAFVNAWIDFDNDGSWAEPGDQILTDEPLLSGGDNTLVFAIPGTAVQGQNLYARFRLNSAGGLSFDGEAADGEVEDYVIQIGPDTAALGRDFGDAPAPYPTTLEWDGARHRVGENPDLFLGAAGDAAAIDTETDGQPDGTATGDNLAGFDDEQGVVFQTDAATGSLTVGDPSAEVQVTIPATFVGDAFVNAWIDFDKDGSWAQLGDQILTDRPVDPGVNTLTFVIPATAVQDENLFARVRLNSTGGLSFDGEAEDGEVEDYVVQIGPDTAAIGRDFGDAPAPFPTTLEWDGARHRVGVNPTLFLGATIDIESDGQPNSTATGDNITGLDDEDGVVFPNALVAGDVAATVEVTLGPNFVGEAFLNAWIDFGNDGSWAQTGDQIFDDFTLTEPGLTTLTFAIPSDAVQGENLFARFRVSTAGGLPFFGEAADGEVEDIVIQEVVPGVDFGDAPLTFDAIGAGGGGTAFHNNLDTDFILGTVIDAETAAQPTATATGDNLAGLDDEDGIFFQAADLFPGNTVARVTVTVTNPMNARAAFLNAWMDFNGNGVFDAATEQIFVNQLVGNGANFLDFNVPATALPGLTYARFRLSSTANLAFGGPAPDGEVEDYAVQIAQPIVNRDFGDAPAPYPTLLAAGGAFHTVPNPAALFLGNVIDVEVDGQPNATATGDDVVGQPDEDGVQIAQPLIAGNVASAVQITLPAGAPNGFLNAWIDFNADGDWNDAGEQIFIGVPVIAGIQNLNFVVPANAALGAQTFARFRLSNQQLLLPIGEAPDGEVEDYVVRIAPKPGRPGKDFGDAPSPFPTELEWDGARHLVPETPTLFLGALIDTEPDGQPNGTATGDNLAGLDDEDGVVFPNALSVGDIAADVTVTASADGLVNAWIDFDNDGSWDDPGEQIFTDEAVVAGANNLAFAIPGTAVQGENLFARFRINSTGGLWFFGEAADGEVEDYVVEIGPDSAAIGKDFGDAPAPFPTTLEWNGARHLVGVNPTLFLGTIIDVEPDGQPNATATGDNLTGFNDEQGVVFQTDPVTGQLTLGDPSATVQVTIPGGFVGDAFLNAWIDFDGDGSWADPGDQILEDAIVTAGLNTLTFSVPGDALEDTDLYTRFRVSSAGGLWFDGEAADGEVEDYVVQVGPDMVVAGRDFGDAPSPFPTTLESNGARHLVGENPTLFLGALIDLDRNGQPNPTATGDNITALDDEDGVVFTTPLIAGDVTATVQVTASADGLLNAWIDFDNDGSWAEAGDQIFRDEPLTAGGNTLMYVVPVVATQGEDLFTRFRFNSAGGLSFDGDAADGEVEDYVVQVEVDPLDFGDAPAPFPTELELDGARHLVPAVPTLFLGALIDTETDGQPNATATGDNLANLDDEDGVVFPTPLMEGDPATIEVTASAAGLLNAWIDFGDDGSWAQAGDQIFNDVPLAAGLNTITFAVPASVTETDLFARFRLSTAGGLSFDGSAADGEVEDYTVQIDDDPAIDPPDPPAPLPEPEPEPLPPPPPPLPLPRPLPPTNGSITVTNTNDYGFGSLRFAIEGANQLPGVQLIDFNIPGAGSHTIQPWKVLPVITDPVIIDATTEPGYEGTPLIELNGWNTESPGIGLNITAGDSWVRGLAITDFAATGLRLSGNGYNVVENNYIGVDVTGYFDAGNGAHGIQIVRSPGNLVGSNVISGNDGSGVVISGRASTDNMIIGNDIGTDASGNVPVPNSNHGILIAGAPGNTVGGPWESQRNLISGNSMYGVSIFGPAASGNTVLGNFIGTEYSGLDALGNGGVGVGILNAPNNMVGSYFDGARNIISANAKHGVRIASPLATGNVVLGNYIGTDANGTARLGNWQSGVTIAQAPGNTIGGTTEVERNVISANKESGVVISGERAFDNLVAGNLIGTDVTGIETLGNRLHGVVLAAPNNTVGSATGVTQVISGNGLDGVLLYGYQATGNTIIGNHVGTNISGTLAVANKRSGIEIRSADNQIGGTATGEGNLISGNLRSGISIIGQAASENTVEGNLIGTNIAGTGAVRNRQHGVLISNAPGNTIGGTSAEAANTISGNLSDGVLIAGGYGARDNKVIGNRIGTSVTGTGPLGNVQNGVDIVDAYENQVGGILAGEGNIIANNRRGVRVLSGDRNSIQRNSMFANDLLGIDLNGDGFSPNDAGDPDPAANITQNFPEITSVVLDASTLTITYSVSSATTTSAYPLKIEFFVADPSGEGKTYLASENYLAPNITRIVTIAAGDAVDGNRIVATATDADGNTSEFSLGAVIGGTSTGQVPPRSANNEAGLVDDAFGEYGLEW